MKEFTAAIVTGILLVVSYQFVGIASFIAYVPLLHLLAYSGRRSITKTCTLLYVTFFIYHAGTNWWISSWQEQTDPYLFTSGIVLMVLHPFFLMLPFAIVQLITTRVGALWALVSAPFVVTAFEWLHGQSDASYPWLTSGYMLTNTWWGQLSELVGVYGITFIIIAINAAIVYTLAQHPGTRTKKINFVLIGTGIALLAIVGIILQQQARALAGTSPEHPPEAPLHVLIVQPNENPWDKWTAASVQVEKLKNITDSAISATPDQLRPTLVVWPETAIPYTIRRPLYSSDWTSLSRWTDSLGISLLTGYADYVEYRSGTAPPSARQYTDTPIHYDIFNAAMLVGERPGGTIEVHRKTRLTPFAERLPFADQLTFAMQWIEWGVGISAWGKGTSCVPLKIREGANVGVNICIESIYPEVSREFVRNGASILAVITNDAWYNGTWGPMQHFRIAQQRAIETRRSIIRCANSGVSGLISPAGESVHPVSGDVPAETTSAAVFQVTPQSALTLYSRTGNILPYTSVVVTILVLVFTRIRTVIRKMQSISTARTTKPL